MNIVVPKDGYEVVNFKRNDEVKAIHFCRKNFATNKKYGVVDIYFNSDEFLNNFDTKCLEQLGGCCTRHIEQTHHRLNVVFFDPEKDPERAVNKAIVLVGKACAITFKTDYFIFLTSCTRT